MDEQDHGEHIELMNMSRWDNSGLYCVHSSSRTSDDEHVPSEGSTTASSPYPDNRSMSSASNLYASHLRAQTSQRSTKINIHASFCI